MKRFIIFKVAVLGGLFAVQALHAQDVSVKSSTPPASKAKAYVWYDGDQKRTVRLDSRLLAQFGTDSGTTEGVEQAFSNAQQIPSNQRGVKLWQVDVNAETEKALRVAKDLSFSGGVSPVFRDGNSKAGRKLALPGNIIVYFDPQWDKARIETWTASQGLDIVDKLRFGKNKYVLKTPPGMEALETANRLYESGEVVAAFPNWWQEVVTR